MPTFASDTRSPCCFLSLLLQLKCTEGNHEVWFELSIRYLEVWVGARAQSDDEYLVSSIITYNYNLSSLYYFKYIPKKKCQVLVGDLQSFSRVLSQSYGHHHARIDREPLRLLHLTAHTPRVWLSSVQPLTRAPLPSPFVFLLLNQNIFFFLATTKTSLNTFTYCYFYKLCPF